MHTVWDFECFFQIIEKDQNVRDKTANYTGDV